jgi:phosphohistidine phosphatase
MTKTLYLMRHAKSSWGDMTLGDFDRPLNERGQRDAPEMGRRLKKRDVKPEIILCSPARRTHQTVERLIRELGGTMKAVQFDDRIYEADPETLLELIRSLPDTCSSAMLIGHNPSMGWLVNHLSDVRIEKMPTCAVATLELPSPNWKNTGTETARLLEFDYPKRMTDGA